MRLALCAAVVVAALAVAIAAAAVGPARATTGGAGLGPTHHAARHRAARHRTAHHRTAHRTARHRGAPRTVRRRSSSTTNPLDGRAMWIWEMGYTDRGNVASIIAGARRYGISTLIVKSSDGTSMWSQFSPTLVRELHAAHLRVCAWQYVYGNHPGVEANLGARAASDGADCLIIDAESEYEGKYVAAQSYVHDLRKQIGAAYPVALAGFPYVDFHPAFPYSVFLGPGGAQDNAPQMYWRDIRTSVDAVYAHTYSFNLIYGRPIFPLGQVYSHPPTRQIMRFRELSKDYGAAGVSWWDWQEAGAAEWDAVSRAAGPLPGYAPVRLMAPVRRGAVGDLVVWAQEHLVSAGYPDAIDGDFGAGTRGAVRAFQAAHGLVADGIVGPDTWRALLRYRPVSVTWVHHGRRTVATAAIHAATVNAAAVNAAAIDAATIHGDAARSSGGAALTLPVPASAARPARRDEIPGTLGAGGRRPASRR